MKKLEKNGKNVNGAHLFPFFFGGDNMCILWLSCDQQKLSKSSIYACRIIKIAKSPVLASTDMAGPTVFIK
jgi:hypothetical protein